MKRLWGKGLLALLVKSASVAAVVAVASTVSISAQAATMTDDAERRSSGAPLASAVQTDTCEAEDESSQHAAEVLP